MISARTQLLAAGLATLLGIVAVAGYGLRSLGEVEGVGRNVLAELNRVATAADIEGMARQLGAEPSGAKAEALEARLVQRTERLHTLCEGTEYDDLCARFESRVDEARAQPSADTWFRAGEVIGEIERQIIHRTQMYDEANAAAVRSRRLLHIFEVVVVFCAAAFAVVFVRWRREQREARERLRKSDRLAALGTIAASVAHEINNPLATISGCAAAVRDRMKRRADAPAEAIEYLQLIEDESRRCGGILAGLRDLARDGPPAMASADVVALARSVVSLVEVDREAKPVSFEVTGAEHVDAICDPDKLKQLLLNLLINARDASEPGGRVTVSVELLSADAARIEVKDRGAGIDPRDLERIFEPFHTDKTRGLGIGLFLCERIASLHGGTIRAQSEGRGKGARFVVEFPTRIAASSTQGAAEATRTAAASR